MNVEKKYKIEFGKQVAKYLKKSGIDINDFARLIKSNKDNVNDILNGRVGLTIGKMVTIANLFGQVYYDFANPSHAIPDKVELVKNIEEVLKRRKSIGNKTIDRDRLLANELDRLISEGYLNKPTTAKHLHSQMDKKLEKRKFTEITNLLSKPPRNQMIVPLFKNSSPKIFIHIDHAAKYEKMSKEEVLKLTDSNKQHEE
ncbi:helix-turn-helix domain-containing protein [Sphingobacterium detergens]|uniref:helix-turn-helix domain-containing protein n=1 Tax=Sphingobacterium detergens TaxID=1145106 RepID=UPI003AADEA18